MKSREERAAELKQITSTFLFARERSLAQQIANHCCHSFIHNSNLDVADSRIELERLSEIRELMNTTPSQFARGSDDTASLVFAVQGRVVSVQRISGQWQPEVFAAGMSSSNIPCMVAPRL